MKALAIEWQIDGQSYRHTVDGEKEIFIGRHPLCDIVLGDLYVSRRHASVIYSNGRLLLQVLSKTNPVVINNIIVGEHDWMAALMPGDAFRVGQVHFLVGHVRPQELDDQGTSPSPGNCSSCGELLDGSQAECPTCGTVLGSEQTLAQRAGGDTSD